MNPHFEKIVDDLANTGWSVQHHCFDPKLIAALSKECEAAHMQAAKIGKDQAEQQASHIRSDKIAWLDETALSTAQQQYLAALEQLRLNLNQTLYLGLFDFEAHFAVYPPNSFYQKHLDQFRNNTSRQVSTICYLNNQWQNAWGGQLKLYDPKQQEQVIQEIYPLANTFVCFLSERFPHEVCRTAHQRLSLTGWFRRR